MNYPRRQQYQRLGHAIATGAGGLLAVLGALLAAAQQALWIALILLLAAVSLSAYARHWSRLAARSRVGARSEEEVQRALSQLAAEGWGVRHSLPWQGRGDIDSVAIAPTGIAFAIEPKTRTYGDQHVARVREMANWLHRRRRRWSPHGALAVLCVVHARGLERFEAAVLIVSLDELVEALRTAAGTQERPTFLAGRRHLNRREHERAIRCGPWGLRRSAQDALAPAAQAPVAAPATFMMKRENPELATNRTATWVADDSRA